MNISSEIAWVIQELELRIDVGHAWDEDLFCDPQSDSGARIKQEEKS